MGSLNAKVVLVGLDNSGKSSIISKLHNPSRVLHHVTPTVGFQTQQISRQGVDIHIYDMSGDSKYRDLWVNYSSKIDGIIFVVDSSDRMRLHVSQSELETLLEDPMLKKDTPVLIYANKADGKDVATVEEIKEILKFDGLGFVSKICKTSVVTGEGLEEGISWLARVMKMKMEKKKEKEGGGFWDT